MASSVKQIPLGKQGFVTSEQGIGMMSIGITMVGSKDLYGKQNDISIPAVTQLLERCEIVIIANIFRRISARKIDKLLNLKRCKEMLI